MEEVLLKKFNVFILENASQEDAIDFCMNIDIDKKSIKVYETLTIDDVRKIKQDSFISTTQKRAFLFNRVRFDAQNALLKTLEEPAYSSYFIFYGDEELLDTIKSRAQIIKGKKHNLQNEELLDAIKNSNIHKLMLSAVKLHTLPKEKLVSILEWIAVELTKSKDFRNSGIINRELSTFKRFNLNQKLFTFALLSKIIGGFKDEHSIS